MPCLALFAGVDSRTSEHRATRPKVSKEPVPLAAPVFAPVAGATVGQATLLPVRKQQQVMVTTFDPNAPLVACVA